MGIYPKLFRKKRNLKMSFQDKIPELARSDSKVLLDREPFFIHIHIPKTGGSTFNTILKNNFGEHFDQFAGRFVDVVDKLSPEQVLKYIQRNEDDIKCIASHSLTALLPYGYSGRRVVAIAFIREPVDKFFSLYFHLRKRKGKYIHKDLTIEQYIDKTLDNLNYNGEMASTLRLFTKEESEDAMRYISELVDAGHLYLFDTNYMGEAMMTLQKVFPNHFTKLNFEVENKSIKDQTVSDELKRKISAHISRYDKQLMALVERKRLERSNFVK